MRNFTVRKPYLRVLAAGLAACALFAADAWRTKQVAAWSDDDAKQVLADSPWVKKFTPAVTAAQQQSYPRGMGRRGMGGIGMGGVGMGIPGMGGGMGRYPGGYPQQGQSQSNITPPELTLRWESALPVRSAELKLRDNDAPLVDSQHYAIAVYGVPDHLLNGKADKLADQLKKDGKLKREGKKDIKASSVQVLERSNGPVIVYLFPMKDEISRNDHRVEFDAKIGRLDLTQSFFTDDMLFNGKLEM